ncbi:MAG: zinc ribbon domain-containing protein [Clostridiales bacterium]|jgi:hypothetical protein|nr:zinc ribbon domain-containing protein [Clostridiales bacterium]
MTLHRCKRAVLTRAVFFAAVFLIATGIFLSLTPGIGAGDSAAASGDIGVVTAITVTSSKTSLTKYDTTFAGKIKNNTDATLYDVKLTVNVKTNTLGTPGSYVITAASIASKQTYTINTTIETGDNFETVTSLSAQIGSGTSFAVANSSAPSYGAGSIAAVREITVVSTKTTLTKYNSVFGGAIKNNTAVTLYDVKVTVGVKTAVVGKTGSHIITIASIAAGQTYTINTAVETDDNFETVTTLSAQIDSGSSFTFSNYGTAYGASSLGITGEIKVASSKISASKYTSTFTGKITNKLTETLYDIKLTVAVKTSTGVISGSYVVTIASIAAGQTHTLNASAETSDNFETVTSLSAKIGAGSAFALTNLNSGGSGSGSGSGGTDDDGGGGGNVGSVVGIIIGVLVIGAIAFFVLRRIFGSRSVATASSTSTSGVTVINNVGVGAASVDSRIEKRRIELERERLNSQTELERERINLEKEKLNLEKDKVQNKIEASKPKYCGYCGAQNDGGSNVCSNCGASF